MIKMDYKAMGGLTLLLIANATLALAPPVALHPWRSFGLYALGFIALYIYCFHKETKANKTLHETFFVLLVGIFLRILFIHYPLSDDVNRYAWEGIIQQHGINPYITQPIELENSFCEDIIFSRINHKEVSAIYPPVAMLCFRLISAIHYSLISYKYFFIGCDILLLILLVPLIHQWQRPAHWLALYAWNPLVLLYGAGEGHLDTLYLFFVVAAWLAFSGKRTAWAGFLLLGMAVMTKYLCIIFLPFFITRKNRKGLVFFLLPFLSIVPFFDSGMTKGLSVFTTEMAYNDVIPRLLRAFTSDPLNPLYMLGVFVFGYGLIWLFIQDCRWTAMSYAYLWCLLCLPCIHVWYLMPLALFMIRVPNRAFILFMTTVGLGFHVMHHQWVHDEWREFGWIWNATYLPLFVLLIYDWKKSGRPWQRHFSPPKTMDILIPVYNEASQIKQNLHSLKEAVERVKRIERIQIRILLIDGGSTDNTLALASAESIDLLKAPLGRGTQLATGWNTSKGDLILLLHADSVIDPNALSKLLHTLQKQPTIGWGVLGHRYEKRMKIIQWLNHARFNCFGIAFGDQGIFLRRELLSHRGGIPDLPLMEDVELSLGLTTVPRASLGESLVVSSRRWNRGNTLFNAARVIGMVFIYLVARRLGANTKQLSSKLYNVYYLGG